MVGLLGFVVLLSFWGVRSVVACPDPEECTGGDREPGESQACIQSYKAGCGQFKPYYAGLFFGVLTG